MSQVFWQLWAELKPGRRFGFPAIDCSEIGNGIKRRIALDTSKATTVEIQKVRRFTFRGEQIAYPLFICPNCTTHPKFRSVGERGFNHQIESNHNVNLDNQTAPSEFDQHARYQSS